MLNTILLLATMLTGYAKATPPDTAYKNHCVTVEEKKLYLLVNDYRKEKNQPHIPLSKSLSFVAHSHMVDLYKNVKEMSHGWSTCKYDAKDKKTWECMWLKPSELTDYKGYGYECVYFVSSGQAKAFEALKVWKKSTPHNNVIINKASWSSRKWNALGVGIYKNYAALWFGEDKETESEPLMCLEEEK